MRGQRLVLSVWIVVALIVVAAVLVVSLPLVASTQIVRTTIAQELSDRTGYGVTLGSAPEIEVWPSFRAVLRDVTLTVEGETQPVVEAERIEADLSAWRALAGEISFSTVTLQRPILRLRQRDGRLYLPAAPGVGRVPDAVRLAEEKKAVSQEPIGTIRFNDARVLLGESDVELVTSATGTLSWPALDQPAALTGSLIWRGESITVSGQVDRPVALMRGEASVIAANVRSAPFSADFKGTLQPEPALTLEGQLSAETPSLRRTLDWFGAGKGPGAAVGAVALSGKVSGDRTRLRVDDARLSVAGNQGLGALDFAFAGDLPEVSGTLAFDTLDIGSFLAAFTPRQDNGGAAVNGAETKGAPAFDLSVIDQFALDLRLSAARATGGPIALSGVAATAQVRPGLAAFDISDARAFGGNVQAGFRVDRKPAGDVGEMRLSATDIDWMLLAESGGWRRNPPRSRGSFSVILKGPVADWASMPSAVTGTIAARFGPGSIDGVDFDKFLKRVVQGGFFPLTEVSPGTLPFEGAEIKATVLGGAARVDAALGWHQNVEVSLGGIVPFLGRGLALSGVVRSRDGVEPAREPRHFFVGGSWSVPYISPMLPVFSPE